MGDEKRETMTITGDDVATISAAELVPVDPMAEFEGKKPLPGAERLGRAIVDKNGFPSGSPANYEALRHQALVEEAAEARLLAGPTSDDVAAAVAAAVDAAPLLASTEE